MPRTPLKLDQVRALLDEISDEQAFDSDFGGDSDAEDVLPVRKQGTGTDTTGDGNSSRNATTRRSSTQAELQAPEVNTIDAEGSISDEHVNQTPVRQTRSICRKETPSYLEDTRDDSDADPDFIADENDSPTINAPPMRIHAVSSSSESESESESEEDSNFTWSKTATDPGDFTQFYFREKNHGAKVEVNFDSPLKIFQKFLPTFFFSTIVYQSNLFATQKGKHLDTTLEELQALIGLLIIMGFHVLPSMRMYWSGDENFYFERVARVMPLQRFLKLLRFLHVNDNTQMQPRGTPGFDKLFKIRPFILQLQEKCYECYQPSRYLSIDESMVAFKGRTSMKQYMPMKPIKRGFKVWVMACAVTGFVVSFEVYTGRNPDNTEPDFGLGEKVVLELSSMFRGLGYILFFDNFFSSLPLAKKLLSHRLFSCGTLRSNRKFYPKNKMKEEKLMKTGDSDFAQSGDISVTKWRDRGKKSVVVVSSLHNPSKTVPVLRTNKKGERDSVQCPEPIAEYNMFMGGVDRFDQLMAAYSISWKSRRWWMKLFYYLIDMAIVNSYILYSDAARKKRTPYLSHLQFRSKLANEMIGTFTSRKRAGPSPASGKARKRNRSDGFPTVENTIRLVNVGAHMPQQTNTRRRCAQCSTKEKEKRSSMICSTCQVALCKACFSIFHSS